MRILQLLLCLSLLICISCSSEKGSSKSVLRIASEKDPQTLDPRIARDLLTVSTLHLLYEGVMQLNQEGKAEPGLASSVLISEDGKLYTFTLRDAYWSNGEPVTAQDIELSWKSMLHPSFPAPNAYQLYAITGAQAYKEGVGQEELVGIFTKGPKTLIVQLDRPSPHFLETLAAHFSFPLNRNWMKQVEENPNIDWAEAPYSGPFRYQDWKRHNYLAVEKNPIYWNADQIKLDQINIVTVDDSTAIHLFNQKELDWIGSPLSAIPSDAIDSFKEKGILHTAPAAGTYWLRLNVRQTPTNLESFRIALAQAINRQELVDHILMGGQQPAVTIVPPLMGLKTVSFLTLSDAPEKAKQSLELALKKLNLSKQNIPAIKICYSNSMERNRKIAQAIQQQWSKTLQMPVTLEACEVKLYADRLTRGDYQVALGSWFADLPDPMNFLEIFESANRSTNQTGWHYQPYKELVERAAHERSPNEQQRLFERAEATLLQEMPVIPLFHSSFLYVKRPDLKGVILSPLGYLNFKHAFLEAP